MNQLKIILISLLTIVTFAANSKVVTLSAKDGFDLKADYFAPKSSKAQAVLMLHQCNYNRSMYEGVGQRLAKQGIHALSLDFRGYGDSQNEQFNVEKIWDLPEGERRPAFREMAKEWQNDVQVAYDYLKAQMSGNGKVGVIGASCGGFRGIQLVENNSIAAIGFFSSNQRDENVERYKKAASQLPTLIIAAEEDGNTYTSAVKLYETTTNSYSKMISYKGGEHGYPLFDIDSDLHSNIANWFAEQLAR